CEPDRGTQTIAHTCTPMQAVDTQSIRMRILARCQNPNQTPTQTNDSSASAKPPRNSKSTQTRCDAGKPAATSPHSAHPATNADTGSVISAHSLPRTDDRTVGVACAGPLRQMRSGGDRVR